MDPAIAQGSGIVRPRPLKWRHRAAAFVIYWGLRLLAATIRYEWRDETGLLRVRRDQRVLFCVWHNRLALCLQVREIYLKRIGRHAPLAVMVSASKDGGILARVLERFGVQPVRGSTSRRGRQALIELTSWAEQGHDLAITPDGPRGPRYEVQHGIVSLARVTGLPIIPVSYWLNWKISLRSWDRFQIPLPFARCVMTLSEPLWVARDTDDADRIRFRQELRERLHAITRD